MSVEEPYTNDQLKSR